LVGKPYVSEKTAERRAPEIFKKLAYELSVLDPEKESRALVVQGLRKTFQTIRDSAGLLTALEPAREPHEDLSIRFALEPTAIADPVLYSLSWEMVFTSRQRRLVIALVQREEVAETLLATNVVIDEYATTARGLDLTQEVKHFMKNVELRVRSADAEERRSFSNVDFATTSAREVLDGLPEGITEDDVRLLVADCSHVRGERRTFRLRIKIKASTVEPFCCWYSTRTSFLTSCTFDASKFPGRDGYSFYLKPFLGNYVLAAEQPGKEGLYELELNDWIVRGQGVVLMWHKNRVNT